MNENPLLNIEQFPDFSLIQPAHALPAIEWICQHSKQTIEQIIKEKPVTWQQFEKLQLVDDNLSKTWTPISHLHSVMNNEDWREAYQACQPIISLYSAEMSQHKGLYEFYIKLKGCEESNLFNAHQKKLIDDAIRDFELSGVGLSDDKKKEYQQLVQSLSELTSTFSNNVLDATQTFSLVVSDVNQLKGIPDSAINLYQQLAKESGEEGYKLTLDFPSYYPALVYAEDRALREQLYHAYATRASELGPSANEYDNTPVINGIINLRQSIANLLGFDEYADLSLVNKMAKKTDTVMSFLNNLVDKAKPKGENEYQELLAFSKAMGINELKPWDVAYVSEKLKQEKYTISQEQLRSYFPANLAVSGLFNLVEKLFSVSFEETKKISVWHDDVKAFLVKNAQGEEIAYFYLDLYARKGKNGGAWMNNAADRLLSSSYQQKPIAYLVCNFIPPTQQNESYLSHDEILTLFHEFGHGLHHMLSKIDYPALSGINGVEWDAVELPSQFMENFCYDKAVIAAMSKHKQTGEALPDDLYNKLIASKNYHSALQLLRQLEFSIFDMAVYSGRYFDCENDVMAVLKEVRERVSVVPAPEYNRFPMSFSHIFAGGYAAGYYSYKWAEVLSADAFAKFEEEGLYTPAVGLAFKQEILEKGSSRTAMENFVAFRGREPEIDALLRHSGII